MSGGVSVSKGAAWLCGALVCAALFLPSVCAAQGRARGGGLPRVGTIKDYPATGLMVGCGNLYFQLPRRDDSLEVPYVFISRLDGSNAWMNLDGRDVRLRQVKTARSTGRLDYRVGSLRVSVLIEELKPEEMHAGDDAFVLGMRITLRRGRAARTVRAVGYSDC